MASRTVHRKTQRRVVGVGGLVIIRAVACITSCRRSFKTIKVAAKTIHRVVGSCQRERSVVVIKCAIRFTGRVTSQAGRIGIRISGYSRVLLVGLRIGMTGDTGVFF